ncbi:WhiB family transcriptional regulator [Streptomyces sp. NPDC002888]|uniref:WhiB family transcriptional regulator n=1 Tax=Streptomyces sp. NPDC002888 TaxID=3364668 RepID=UPI0036B13A50
MRMASHTALSARSSRGPVRGAHIPDAALPCRRRPDVFQHPLLESADTTTDPTGPTDTSPEHREQRRQHLVLQRTARDLCASCPLWAECLQDAVAHAEPSGYAAATTQEDRRWMRRTLGIGDAEGDLPTRQAEGFGATARRLTRLRSRTGDRTGEPTPRHPSEHGLPELDRILDAFDLRQNQLAQQQRALQQIHPAVPEQLHEHTGTQPTHRQPPTYGPTESGNEDMAAAESGQRIAFSYEDPAQAVRQTLLGPLIRSALPALTSLEQLVAMLMSVPGGEVTSDTVREVRAVRTAVESLLPESTAAPEEADASPRTLTGSVSLELATTDPVTALRRDFVEPLLRELAASLGNIEKVATMLAATSADGDEAHLEAIRTALLGIRSHLPHPAPPGRTTTAAGSAPLAGTGRRSAAAPSIRAAVEAALATFPGPFSARDILRALPPGVYGDPSKTISNVLSALVKSGRLRRLARGTYARTPDVPDHGLPEQDEAKSA